MKKYLLFLFLVISTPMFAQMIEQNILKNWIDSNKDVVILDARSKSHFNDEVIPKAKWLPHNANPQEIAKAIPSKNTPIVVYCSNVRCPASDKLAKRLKFLGYSNVNELHGGISEWKKAGYPVAPWRR